MKRRKRTHQSRKSKFFLVRGYCQRPWSDDDKCRAINTRQRLKREIDREIRSYE